MSKFKMHLHTVKDLEVEADSLEEAEQKFLEEICNWMSIDDVDEEENN